MQFLPSFSVGKGQLQSASAEVSSSRSRSTGTSGLEDVAEIPEWLSGPATPFCPFSSPLLYADNVDNITSKFVGWILSYGLLVVPDETMTRTFNPYTFNALKAHNFNR